MLRYNILFTCIFLVFSGSATAQVWESLTGTFDSTGELTGITGTARTIIGQAVTHVDIEFTDASGKTIPITGVRVTPNPPPRERFDISLPPPPIPSGMTEGAYFDMFYRWTVGPSPLRRSFKRAEVDNWFWYQNELFLTSLDQEVPGSAPEQSWELLPAGAPFRLENGKTTRNETLASSLINLSYVQTSPGIFDAFVEGNSFLKFSDTFTISILEDSFFGELEIGGVTPSGSVFGTLSAIPLGGTVDWFQDASTGETSGFLAQTGSGQGTGLTLAPVPLPMSGGLLSASVLLLLVRRRVFQRKTLRHGPLNIDV